MMDTNRISTQEQKTAAIVAQAATATAKAVLDAANAAALLIAKEREGQSVEFGILKSTVARIEKDHTDFERDITRRIDELEPKFDKIYAKLEEIALGRPTWAILMIITALFSLSSGLIVWIASHT